MSSNYARDLMNRQINEFKGRYLPSSLFIYQNNKIIFLNAHNYIAILHLLGPISKSNVSASDGLGGFSPLFIDIISL
jgi:hypothetical protein